jgi:hypothetical protein
MNNTGIALKRGHLSRGFANGDFQVWQKEASDVQRLKQPGAENARLNNMCSGQYGKQGLIPDRKVLTPYQRGIELVFSLTQNNYLTQRVQVEGDMPDELSG